MASLKTTDKSPFWYLKYKALDGSWREKSLRPLRKDTPADTRKAKAIEAEHTMEENRRAPSRDLWHSWVPDYLETRYGRDAASRKRSLNSWNHLSAYFEERSIRSVQELTYRACMEYLPWRKRKAAHNTALLELKYLNVICKEAVRRGLITISPASGLGIGKERGREKPALTDAQIDLIRSRLRAWPEWMGFAFEVAINQGCRISETAIFCDDLDFVRGTIHFRRTKGDKPFTAPMNPDLRPMLERLVARGGEKIFELPVDAPRRFHRFFAALRSEHTDFPAAITFHSTRVTVASRMAQAGYSITKAMRLLNHSSELVHRSYQRLAPADVEDAFLILRIPPVRADNPLNENPDAPSTT